MKITDDVPAEFKQFSMYTMGKVNYLLLDMSVLPEVYVKVIEAKGYLQS